MDIGAIWGPWEDLAGGEGQFGRDLGLFGEVRGEFWDILEEIGGFWES